MLLTHELARGASDRITRGHVYGHLIGGEWVGGSSGETIALENPATRQTIAHIQAGSAEDVARAVDAAAAAFPKWSQSSAAQRQMILRAIATNRARSRPPSGGYNWRADRRAYK
jgi:aldehyde dehydrogenase